MNVDLSGGFYDAGDHVKFNFPASFAISVMNWGLIDFKSGYETAGEYQNGKRISRWGLDYFIKCHTSPTELYAQVGLPFAIIIFKIIFTPCDSSSTSTH